MVSKEQVVQWLHAVAGVLEQSKEYLTELDAAIGDADHGINMDRGFRKVVEKLPVVADGDIGSILKGTGMTLVSSVGGASGPLYGTLFMRAGMAVQAKNELNATDVAALLQAGLAGVVERGKAQVGDKTMVDALVPGVEAFEKAVKAGHDTAAALQQAVAATKQGMKDTIPLRARKGRASYLGERSVGHQDPGATSTFLMLKTLLDAVSSKGT